MVEQKNIASISSGIRGGATLVKATTRPWLILTAASVAQLMLVLDGTIMNVALPSAQMDLGFSDIQRHWVVTAYALSFGSLLLLGGRIGDVLNRKLSFLIGLAGFAVASAIAGAAPNFATLVGARALQGVFGALLAPAALAVLAETFPDGPRRIKAFSIFGAISGAGAGLGLLLGGVLTEILSWRWTLYVNIFFAVGVLLAGLILLPTSKRQKNFSVDIPGAMLITIGLFLFVYGFGMAESEGLGSWLTLGVIAGGMLFVAGFIWWQKHAASPLLPLSILYDRIRGGAFLAVFFSSAGLFAHGLFLTYYLQITLGYTPLQGGLAFLPMNITIILSSITLTPWLMQRFGPRLVVSGGMLVCVISMLMLLMLDMSSLYIWHILPSLIVMGIGMGTVIGTSMALATLGVSPHNAGAASATLNSMLQVGGSMGVALLTSVAALAAAIDRGADLASGASAAAQSQLVGSLAAFAGCAALYGIGAVVVYFTYPAEHAEKAEGSELAHLA